MADTKAMTYPELAEALGIGVESAKNLVRRKRWSRSTGNDGMARVIVPIEALMARKPASPHDAATSAATSPPTDPPMASVAIETLSRHIERLEAELATVKSERDQAKEAAMQVHALRATLEAVSAERDRWMAAATAPRGLARLFRRA